MPRMQSSYETASPWLNPRLCSKRWVIGQSASIRLKAFVRSNLPSDSAMRKVIEADQDSLPIPEYISRLALWLRLLDSSVL